MVSRRFLSINVLHLILTIIITKVLHLQVRAEALKQKEKPNLVIIYTDEQSIRTIGCYRERMKHDQAYIWGNGVAVDTPNIDSIARDGAMFTNFYASSPMCTPSRSSWVTGMYPNTVGSWKMNPMHKNVTTFAEVLRRKRGYMTSYIGKWHLNGKDKPGWAKESSFGFKDVKYLYNRGHWKYFQEIDGNVTGYHYTEGERFASNEEEAYGTDFLFDRAVEFIKERDEHRDKPYALMLSIPDPHDPNIVRKPYDEMYNHFDFNLPRTQKLAMKKNPALPKWSAIETDINSADAQMKRLLRDEERQQSLRNYFGMVKCIDDNVGKIISVLKELRQEDNTILVFSSDHGDLLGEHAKDDKGRPYKTSAGVPFIIRYPNKIQRGKVIETAYSGVDFAPTILSLMGVDSPDVKFHGIDGASELLSRSDVTNDRDQIRYMHGFQWAAAMNSQYMLVLAKASVPWLFDRENDPDETINLLANKKGSKSKTHQNIPEVPRQTFNRLYDGLYHAMNDYRFPVFENSFVHYDYPDCMDNPDQLHFWKKMTCVKLSQRRFKHKCNQRRFQQSCPMKCGLCCSDSEGFMLIKQERLSCKDVKKRQTERLCADTKVERFCPSTCESSQCSVIGMKTYEDVNKDVFLQESHHQYAFQQSQSSSYDGALYYGYE